jgi:hypothetical protein
MCNATWVVQVTFVATSGFLAPEFLPFGAGAVPIKEKVIAFDGVV